MKRTMIFISLLFSYFYGLSQINYGEIQPQVKKDIQAFYQDKVSSGEIVSSNDINSAKKGISKDLTALNKVVNSVIAKSNESAQVLGRMELMEHIGDYSTFSMSLINVITSSFEQNNIQLNILELNNPTENGLGFSLKEVMNQMIDNLILQKMGVKNAESAKVSGIVNSIIESPITKILGSAVPVINNIVNFIANLTIGNKKLTPEDLKNFMAKINEYFKFYELLSENNKSFKANMYELNVKAEALRLILKNFILDRVKIYYEGELSKENLADINKVMSEYLTQSIIKSRYKKITTEDGKPKADDVILNLEYLKMPSTTVSQAQYLIDEIESLSNQYINAYTKYIRSVNESLEAAKTLKNFEGKQFVEAKVITDKQEEFLKKLTSWESTFKNSLNIVAIRDIVSQMTKLKPY